MQSWRPRRNVNALFAHIVFDTTRSQPNPPTQTLNTYVIVGAYSHLGVGVEIERYPEPRLPVYMHVGWL